MELVDTHCHLDFDAFSRDRDAVIADARKVGVSRFVIPAVKQATWDSLIKLCNQNQDLYYALGLHPVFIAEHNPQHVDSLQQYIERWNPVAVGEIGLDFYIQELDRNAQLDIFDRQIDLAREVELPVILHVRKAHDVVLSRLAKSPVVGGIVHAFNGSLQQAKQYLKLNFKFGFGGKLTYERSTKLRTLARELPIESIVLETDSPDMTVKQHRGERNSPAYLVYCLQALAEAKSMDLNSVAKHTTRNAHEALHIN